MRRGKDRDCSTIIKTKKSPELKNEGTVSSCEDALLWSSGYFNFKSRFIAFELGTSCRGPRFQRAIKLSFAPSCALIIKGKEKSKSYLPCYRRTSLGKHRHPLLNTLGHISLVERSRQEIPHIVSRMFAKQENSQGHVCLERAFVGSSLQSLSNCYLSQPARFLRKMRKALEGETKTALNHLGNPCW